MRVLLDECLPRKLKKELQEHAVSTVQKEGWSALKNGELLKVASARFDVFLTTDRNIPFQQNLAKVRIGIVVIVSGGIRLEDLQPFMGQIRAALPRAKPGQLIRVGSRPHHFRLKESPYSAAASRSVLMTSWSSGVR